MTNEQPTQKPQHGDLFSGIGGFALAAQWAGFETRFLCEIDPYCQGVLKARFGAGCVGGPSLYSDIRALDGRQFYGLDLFTAGVPCQPASQAGKRRGREDDRWLWPETLRILGEVKPTVAVCENPPGILTLESGVVFEDLLLGMESHGYEVCPPIVIPACGVGAGHRRYRVFVVAHLESGRFGQRNQDSRGSSQGTRAQGKQRGVGSCDSDASHPERTGLEEREKQHARAELAPTVGSDWPYARPETDLCLLRKVHGLPRELDRRARIHALGNAVVPAQVYPILKAIRSLTQ